MYTETIRISVEAKKILEKEKEKSGASIAYIAIHAIKKTYSPKKLKS